MRYIELDRSKLPHLDELILCGSCKRPAFLFFVKVGAHHFPTFNCSEHGNIHPVRVPHRDSAHAA